MNSHKSENNAFTNKNDSKHATNNNKDNCKTDTYNNNQNHCKIDNNNDYKTNSYTRDFCIVHEEINVIMVKKEIDLYEKQEIKVIKVIRETKETTEINGINVITVLCRKPLYQYIDL
jgi:hypothetical protein